MERPPLRSGSLYQSSDNHHFTSVAAPCVTMPQSQLSQSLDEFQSPLRQQRFTLSMACFSLCCMSFTIFFAYNCSLEQPISSKLIFERPERSILVLNILSQLSIFSLAELTSAVLEEIRWALACSTSGTSAYTFLALSRATNMAGVLRLFLGHRGRSKFEKGGFLLWGSQRLFFILLRFVLGILLLADISFRSTYPPVHKFPVVRAGLSPLNVSVVDTDQFNLTATASFWLYFPALLTDTKKVRSVAPVYCTSDFCNSYFLPGSMSTIVLDPNLPPITEYEYLGATSYIQNDAPGYQLDFQPISNDTDPAFDPTDCEVYGVSFLALQVCLKTSGLSLLGAWNPCPWDVRISESCLNTTEWLTLTPFSTKMTINNRRASTVFDRFNLTITDIIDISDPTPTVYEPSDFFTFYEIVYDVNQSLANWASSTQYMFLLGTVSFLENNVDVLNGTGSDDRVAILQEFLAVPIVLFNNVVYGGPTPDMGNSVTLAIPGYRLIIAPYTLYLFSIGGAMSLLWCLIALTVSLSVQTPNTSLFPEIDLASKVVYGDIENNLRAPGALGSISQLLWPLSNAGSSQIVKRLARIQIYARFLNKGSNSIIIDTQDNGFLLKLRRKNSSGSLQPEPFELSRITTQEADAFRT